MFSLLLAIPLHSLTLQMVLDSDNLGADELIFNPALASLHTYLGGMDVFLSCVFLYLTHLSLRFSTLYQRLRTLKTELLLWMVAPF